MGFFFFVFLTGCYSEASDHDIKGEEKGVNDEGFVNM